MSNVDAKTEPKASIQIRVFRAATGEWEEPITVPAAIEDKGDPATLTDRLRSMFGLTKPEKE